MGADMLVAIIRQPKDDELPAIRQRIVDLDRQTLADVRFNWDGNECNEDADFDETRAYLLGALDEVVEDRRDICWHQLEGVVYLITGGLSYGDSPTDAFDLMNSLAISGVLEEEVTE